MFREYAGLSLDEKRKIAAEIVARYETHRQTYIRTDSTYNESQLRSDFLNEYLILLGWDLNNVQAQSQDLRDVVVEESLTVQEEDRIATKKPDYTMRIGGTRKFFVEAKRPSVSILSHKPSAFQVKRYIWNAGLRVSVLTNFENLVIYMTPLKNPNEDEDAHIGQIVSYSYKELASRFDEIYDRLSYESSRSGKFEKHFELESLSGAIKFDDYFLAQIKKWQLLLAKGILSNNLNVEKKALNLTIQRILNKILFLRICEDRNLEDYKTLLGVRNYAELKDLFKEADQRYNSGLFDILQDPMGGVVIPDAPLIQIFSELYLPNSSFNFSVVEPSILSEIYENFIRNEVTVGTDGQALIQEKPEVAASNGVVITPQFIVDRITKSALALKVDGKSPEEIAKLKIADIACGSGVFLLKAFDYLCNYHLDWYRKDGEEKHSGKIRKDSSGNYYLNLGEKHRILKNCIYGVDIDYQAIEVARFSLSIKVVEDSSRQEIEDYLRNSELRALPSLGENIVCGNSLIDDRFEKYLDGRHISIKQLVEINPFSFSEAFRGFQGFDVIIGNPPYVRIQNMIQYSPEEVEFFRSKDFGYKVAHKDLVDKYAIFIERALQLLSSSGVLSYIVPHKFMKIRSGTGLRDLISKGKFLKEVIHFGTNQIKEGRLTYTCILTLTRTENPNFTVEPVDSFTEWTQNKSLEKLFYEANYINESPWIFITQEVQAVFDKIKTKNPKTLKDFAHIFVGVQTSANPIYILKPLTTTETHIKIKSGETEHFIERGILKPIFSKVEFEAFDSPVASHFVIYPYEIIQGKVHLLTKQEMQARYPNCWNYLESFKETLAARDIENPDGTEWYKYGRNQSLDKFDGTPKLVWPVLSLEPRYCIDNQNSFFTGGGNGPYYGLRPLPKVTMSLQYIQAVLSHPVIDAFILVTGSSFQDDYISHGKQFIEKIPLHEIDFTKPEEAKAHEEITGLVNGLNELVVGIKQITIPAQKAVIERKIKALRQEIHSKIDQLYQIDTQDHQVIMGLNSIEAEQEPE